MSRRPGMTDPQDDPIITCATQLGGWTDDEDANERADITRAID